MGLPARGDIVVVNFPFSDLSRAKPRPALVVGSAGKGDYVLCQITSRDYHGDAVEVDPADVSGGALRGVSYVRPLKLFTSSSRILRATIGKVADVKVEEVIDRIVTALGRTP